MAGKEWGDEIIFLRSVVPGAAGQSYGVQVAKLAGLPPQVITRAREILRNLESEQLLPDNTPRLARHGGDAAAAPQADLFSAPQQAALQELRQLRPDAMTPLEALNRLVKLKELAG